MPTRGRHADDDQADEQRDARARQHARQDVAPQLVEPEPVRAGGPFEPQRQLLAAGSNGTTTGPTTRRPAPRSSTIAAPNPASFVADPSGSSDAVDEVGEQVHADVGHAR